MAVTLNIRTDGEHITPTIDGVPLAEPTPLATLPSLEELQADVYEGGKRLTEALGGTELTDRLDADDGVLLLSADNTADLIPWEFAALPGRTLFGCQYGLLRLVKGAADPPRSNGPLQFVALGADPLVDDKGNARDGYRLDIDNELAAIRHTLARSGKDVWARRIPPTKRALRQALRRGPALL
ncbi:MAG: hypothetical protein GXP37_08920, partial [Chloroflexi bacterium]|nr:hypothetical protein [Chloroflexota bacterium]